MKTALYIVISFIICVLVVTYAKWEYLSWQHGQEFIKPLENQDQSDFVPITPNFLKVIEYNTLKAKVFIKDEKIEYMVYFYRDKNNNWFIGCWDYCLAANGSSGCFFPWYSADTFDRQITYYSPNGGSCKREGY
ncbi:hypothetical protein JMG10_43070 [Nostoc ellipsosporum NOK]|nr:hypothetical protein [Nostoc ellipsosporum NOK]